MEPRDLGRLSDVLSYLSDIPHANLQDASRRAPFTELIELCAELFPVEVGVTQDGQPAREDIRWALLHLFDTTGVPTNGTATAIATEIENAMLARGGEIVHLCPLDQADTLPPLHFGPCEVRTFSKSEFSEIIQYARLKRRFPGLDLDIGEFARFDWLVVREPVMFGTTLEKRSGFFRHLDFRLDRDFGAIQPYARKWPIIVEKAVFALLLLPWEEMVQHRDIDWRAFRIPWVYSLPSDIFEGPSYPRGPETLTWEPDFYFDSISGKEVETQRPFRLPLNDEIDGSFANLTDARWNILDMAQSSPIFNPLVMHFLVRAFTSDGIDEFLGHVTTVEAALGMSSDFGVGTPRPLIGKKNPGATVRVKRRIAALTGDSANADVFEGIFNLRSTFIHGRKMDELSSARRVQARVLARNVVECLIQATQARAAADRDAYLTSLCP